MEEKNGKYSQVKFIMHMYKTVKELKDEKSMAFSTMDLKNSIRKLRPNKHFQPSKRIKLHIRKLAAFLYTNDKHTKKNIRETSPLAIA